jgi:hypothetical protein
MNALTPLKIAALAPMPSASVSTATAVTPGVLGQHPNAEANVLEECFHHQILSTRVTRFACFFNSADKTRPRS